MSNMNNNNIIICMKDAEYSEYIEYAEHAEYMRAPKT